MRVFKDTPFEFSYMPWETHPPEVSLMVVVKGTFDLVHRGACAVSEEQAPTNGPVEHEEGGDEPSLRLETDYAVLKPKAEWYLTGSAWAPAGRPTTVVPVRVKVGALEKELVVWGDRFWQRGVIGAKASDPAPFESLPLCWERAFGGPGFTANPVGRGLVPIQGPDGAVHPLPNIENPKQPLLSKGDRPEPVGMFPIPIAWPQRQRKTGTYDQRWLEERWPWFPTDFEYSFFNCAPLDQQREGYWRGDERIELQGLDPELTRLETRLPGLRARCFVQWVDPERPEPGTPAAERLDSPPRSERDHLRALGPPPLTEVPLHLDTIVIDSDARKVVCSWRGLAKVQDDFLTNVERLFFVHEPIDTEQPLRHYEEWLLRKILEEADDTVGEDEEPDAPAADPDSPQVVDFPEDEAERVRQQLPMIQAEMLAAVAEMLPEERWPPAAELRRMFEDAGEEPPEELVDVEPPPPVVDLQESPSLLRLEAIVRRRRGLSFAGLDLSGRPYRGLDLGGCDFSGAVLVDADLSDAGLRGARLDGAILYRAKLDGADLREASLEAAELAGASANGARFEGAKLDGLTSVQGSFERARFQGASMVGAQLEACAMKECDFRSVKADGLDLSDSFLDGSNFTGASLEDAAIHGASCRGVSFERCRLVNLRASEGTDLRGARIVLADAAGAQFQRTALEGAIFAGSNLPGSDFTESRAPEANFLRCVLRSAVLDRCILARANFMQADLVEASLERSDLRGADFRGAVLFSAGLWRAIRLGALTEGAVLDRTLAQGD